MEFFLSSAIFLGKGKHIFLQSPIDKLAGVRHYQACQEFGFCIVRKLQESCSRQRFLSAKNSSIEFQNNF